MSRIVVTAGDVFTDIDAYASAIAYTQLQNLLGNEAEAVLAGPLNVSVPEFLKEGVADYRTSYTPRVDDKFVLVDISEPEHVASFVDHHRVELLIDHRKGYGKYWEDLGVKAQLEVVGAACTQVYEKWQEQGLSHKMPAATARVLAAGILDNTLNFSSTTTNSRDHLAYASLLAQAGLDESFAKEYFSACQAGAVSDIEAAILSDTKYMEFPGYGVIRAGQLALWELSPFIDQIKKISISWSQSGEQYFINLIDISNKRNIILSQHNSTQKFVSAITDCDFDEGMARTSRMWLRKELLAKSLEHVNA